MRNELMSELNTVINKIVAVNDHAINIQVINEITNKLIATIPYTVNYFSTFGDMKGHHYGGFRLGWSTESGSYYGQYDVINDTDFDEYRAGVYMQNGELVDTTYSYELKVHGESETMDSNEDKSFLKLLLLKLIDEIDIVD